jgi:hypothetical protein
MTAFPPQALRLPNPPSKSPTKRIKDTLFQDYVEWERAKGAESVMPEENFQYRNVGVISRFRRFEQNVFNY